MNRRFGLLTALAMCAWYAGLVACSSAENDPDVPDYELEVDIDETSTGFGSVESDEGDIDCPAVNCIANFDDGYYVELGAFPDPLSYFDQWFGDCAGQPQIAGLTMNADMFCEARFLRGAQLRLIYDGLSDGDGDVYMVTAQGDSTHCTSGDANCFKTVPPGDSLAVSAVAATGSTFAGWGDDCLAYGTNLSFKAELTVDLSCSYRFNLQGAGGAVLQPRGSFPLSNRVEAALIRAKKVYTAAFDVTEGQIVDFTDPDNLTSAVGPEYSSCFGARGLTTFFSPLPQYLQDVIHATCVGTRQGTLTPSSGGFTQVEFYNFAPGEADPVPGTTWEAVTDFEFGRLRLFDRGVSPAPDVLIPLSNPLERSCPFSIAIDDSIAYVAGREGVVGTSTENCENWHGLWRVNLNSQMTEGFTEFGTKLRNVIYYDEMAFVADFEEDVVHVIDGGTGVYDHAIDVGDGPTDLVIEDRPGALNDRLYVTNWNTNLVKVFDLVTEQELDSQPSGGIAPVRLFLDGATLIVLNFGDVTNDIDAVLKAFTVQ